MKKNRFRYTLRLSFIIYSVNFLSGLITFLLVLILSVCGIQVGALAPLVLALLVLASCLIIAFIFSYFQTRNAAKSMVELDAFLDKIASGDFTARLSLNSKKEYERRLSEKLNLMASELDSISILKNDFVRNFSHEFKTPIASIKGFSELLCQNNQLSEEEKEKYLNIIKEESNRLTLLAEKTLLFSKIQSQNVVINKEEYFVDEQIEECAMQLFKEVEQKNIQVDIDLSHKKILGSKELCKELWLNLFSNAVKYTKENGKIRIFDYETSEGMTISFQDNGIGIKEEARKHIFDEYYQENPLNNGIGVGLAICHKITDLHNWKISVSSKENEGSVFSVLIPENSHD